MNLKEKFINYKNQLQLKKQQEEKELKETLEKIKQADYNVYTWYEVYGNEANANACGVGFITPDFIEICTNTTKTRHDGAARNLFYKHYKKDLEKEEKIEKLSWFNLLPKYYNIICFELVSPYGSGGRDMLIFLPDKINEFQKEMLHKIQNEIDYYNENITFKVRYHAGYKNDEDDFERIDEILDRYYNLERKNKRSEYHGKI